MTRAPQSMDEAVASLRPVDRLGLGLGPAHPTSFLHALAGRTDFTDLTIYGALLTDLFDIFTRSGVHHQSGFFGPAERFLIASGADVQFVPADFRRFAPALERVAPRVVATAAAPPDGDGYCSLSLHAGATWGEVKRAAADPHRVLIVEVNAALPHTFGLEPDHPHRLHVDEIDVLVEGDRPLYSLVDPEPTEVDRAIAANTRPFIVDGSTLQTGIGSIPSTIISLLATEHDGGGYGVHSEMFTTGLMQLHRAGKVTNDAKGIYDGFSVTTFALGSTELYQWLDGNPDVRFLPASIVNSPDVIARNRRMVTINGAMQIDLYGQAVADTINGVQYSGIGGHEDFIAASGLELEDRSIVCLPATVTVGGEVLSRIVPTLAAGAVITTPRHQLDVVVTEHGVAELPGPYRSGAGHGPGRHRHPRSSGRAGGHCHCPLTVATIGSAPDRSGARPRPVRTIRNRHDLGGASSRWAARLGGMRHLRHGRLASVAPDPVDAFHVAPQQVAAAWWDGLGSEVPSRLPVIHAARAAELASAPAPTGADRHAA